MVCAASKSTMKPLGGRTALKNREKRIDRRAKREAPRAASRNRRIVPLVVAASALALTLFVIFAPRGSGGGHDAAPTLGEHLHSLLAFDGTRLLVGTHGASALSSDGGKSLAVVAGLDGVDAMESAASRSGGTLIVAGHDGAKLSADGGKTWEPYGTTLPGTDIHALALDSADAKHAVAYVAGIGIFETTDGGRTWRQTTNPPAEPMGTGIIDGKTMLLPAASGSISKSIDHGATWTTLGRDVGGMTLAADPASAAHLFLSGSGPLFVSNDAGTTWHERTLPAGAQIVVPGGRSTLYAAGYGDDKRARTWSSDDGGTTWLAERKG